MNTRTFAVLLAVVCGGCSFSASCGKKSVKADEVEADIKERVAALGLTPDKVDCDDDVEAKVGATFTCKVGFASGASHDLAITVTAVDDKAERASFDTRWTGGSAIVATKLAGLVTGKFTERFGAGVAVDCGADLRFISADKKLPCDITAGAYRGKVTVLFDDEDEISDVTFDDKLLVKKSLEDLLTPSVREQTSPTVVVTCGDQVLVPRPADGVVWCDIVDGAQAAKIRVEVDDNLDVKTWAVAEPPP
jgi:hypothetical protein